MRITITRWLVPVLLLLTGCSLFRPTASHQEAATIAILHINDVYEISPLENGTVGGMARVATLRRQLETQYPNRSFAVLSGDFLSPSVMGTVKLDGERVRGAQMVDAMNQAGITWVTFGNHEFDIPEADLQKRINESRFTWIAGNVRHQTAAGPVPFARAEGGREVPFQPWIIQEVPLPDGQLFRLGIIAVCLPFNKAPYVHYEDVFASAAAHYDLLKGQTDAVVAITHLNYADDSLLALRVPGLALIMGGHDHTQMFHRVGQVPIAKADANAKTAWIHRLQYNTRSKTVAIASELVPVDASVPMEPETQTVVGSWESRAYQAFKDQGFVLDETVTLLSVPLDGLEAHIRTSQTNLGAALTDAMLVASPDAALAVINSGSVRIDDYLQGKVTQFDLIRALPFGGRVLKVDMQGDLLKLLLDTGAANTGSGGYLQLGRVTRKGDTWVIGGAALDPARVYRVAITDFLMTGGEKNMGFLLPSHPGVRQVIEPGAADLNRDIRMVLAEYLKSR
ncbi:MAG: bifunctional metallophosphatase/5'-nucleotidase [Bacteroidia bacterium]|nr:bifunctional metallophosphatase/5'-nucleotidase [Bacteroidia bacterium]